MITLQELARLAGVSHTTVSLVLRGKHKGRVSAAKREEIFRLVRKYGYRPNLAARGLVQGRTYRIAFCIHGFLEQRPLLGQFSFHDALAAAARKTQAAGYTIELIETDPGRRIEEHCRELAPRAVDGFLLIGWPVHEAERLLLSFKEKHIPAGALGTTVPDDGLTWSDVDRGGAIRAATASLMEDGHTMVALLDLDVGGCHRETKEEAFLAEVRERSGKDAVGQVFRMHRADIGDAISITHQALDAHPELRAFLLSDNFFADAVMFALRRRGMEPGKDCRLIGLGDTILADRTRPRLTHYSLMIPEQAAFVVEALLEEIQGPLAFQPRHAVFQSTLVAGAT